MMIINRKQIDNIQLALNYQNVASIDRIFDILDHEYLSKAIKSDSKIKK